MANGSLNVTHNFTGETGYIIAVIVKSTAPLTEIERVVYPAPHSQETYLFENLQPVWHLIRFWRSSDGVALDEEILTLAGNARTGALFPISRYEYVVDRGESDPGVWADPVQDDTGIRDTRLYGHTYWVEERGTGSLLTTEIVDRSDEGGGFDFADGDKVMNSGGVYIVTVIERVDASDSGSGGAVQGEGIYILDVNEDYSNSLHSGKILIADFSTVVGTLTIPNLSLVPDGEFTLQTHGGMQRNVVIQLDAGDTVKFRKDDVNKIILGEGEQIKIIFLDNVMYVVDLDTNHFRLGQRIFGDTEMLNTAIADGSEEDQADFPRVVELMDSLPFGAVVSYTTWDTLTDGEYPNRGKFARDDIAGTFRFPDMRNHWMKAMQTTSGAAGSRQNESVGPHTHFVFNETSVSGDGTNVDSTNSPARSNETNGNVSYRIKASASTPTRGITSSGTGTQNAVDSFEFYPLICI